MTVRQTIHERWCTLPAEHKGPCAWGNRTAPVPDVVVIRDSAGAPVYAIEVKTDRPTDDEKRRVVADMLSFRLLPDAVRDYLTGYLAALED